LYKIILKLDNKWDLAAQQTRTKATSTSTKRMLVEKALAKKVNFSPGLF
jgi:hypothetical protein